MALFPFIAPWEVLLIDWWTKKHKSHLNSRTERLIFHKCLIYRRPKFLSQSMSIHPEPLPLLKPMDLLLALWVVSPYFILFTHKTVYPINELTCSFPQFVCPVLQFLFFCQINTAFLFDILILTSRAAWILNLESWPFLSSWHKPREYTYFKGESEF